MEESRLKIYFTAPNCKALELEISPFSYLTLARKHCKKQRAKDTYGSAFCMKSMQVRQLQSTNLHLRHPKQTQEVQPTHVDERGQPLRLLRLTKPALSFAFAASDELVTMKNSPHRPTCPIRCMLIIFEQFSPPQWHFLVINKHPDMAWPVARAFPAAVLLKLIGS
ncbi:unnamed protein product [Dovyalis caffra]|uniref:Uncharacterized protein n=1 Tax=Dovyalis caffra TaxID=77055 RepID=A0AAV1R3G5_9ROSI|nr:unnamed protein product [Dovyalis caffra]